MIAEPTCLGALVARRAASNPDAPAVRSGDLRLAWNELDHRCRAIGHALVGAGVGPGDRVGIWLHKSVDSMAAVHATLRVGAVYVPLDPAAPPAQVAAVLRDADAAAAIVAVKARRASELAAAMPGLRLVEPDAAVAAAAGSCPELPPVPRGPEDPAYLMYTSGSTGRPKGIVHTNRSGLAYARRAAAHYGLRPDDVLANIAPLHFDQSTFELFCAPISGAEALFVPEPYLRLPASLAELVERERPTVWYSVPSVLAMLADRGALEARDLSSLRWVLFGGEVFAPSTVRRLMTHMPEARWSNVYGPAEVNQVTFHDFTDPPGDEPIPIGDAWDATELAIVDGELLVRTDTVMAGYWRRPDLDAAAFVEGPDGRHDWYRTGDLVERRSDGLLVFCGRRDNQVKVRGQRVELEAVDRALAAIPGVVRAAGIVVAGADGLGEIVGAVIVDARADADSIAGTVALAHLRDLLPAYALPRRIVVMDSWPETSNGKLDRGAVARALFSDRVPEPTS